MRKLVERIIGIDLETQKRAIVSIITYVVDGLYLFGGIQVPDEKVDYVIKGVLAIVTAIVWMRGFFMNENYTPEGCEGTGYTRMKKLEAKGELAIDTENTEEDGYALVIEDVGDDDNEL